MRTKYDNIEYERLVDGSYRGWSADGRSWSIRGCTGNWTAKASVTRQGSLSTLAGYSSLGEISYELKRIK